MVALARLPGSMSVDEFLLWEPGDGRMWQLVDGEPQAMAPASQTHGALQAELARIIGNHLRDKGSPCFVVVTPGVVPRVRGRDNVRIPDVAVRCSRTQAREAVMTEPVLVVEILSPSNEDETWSNVYAYTTIPSVKEILVLWTDAIGAEVLRRGADGSWAEEPDKVTRGDLVLDSIGIRTPLAALYRDTDLGGA